MYRKAKRKVLRIWDGFAQRMVRKSGYFDESFYLAEYPDVAAVFDDPFSHYWTHGWLEGRRPSADFHPAFVAQGAIGRHLSRHNPILAWLLIGRWLGWSMSWPQLKTSVSRPALPSRTTIAIVLHEATRTGAPIFALRLARWLRRSGTETIFVLLNDGSLLPEIWPEFECVPIFSVVHSAREDVLRQRLGEVDVVYLNSLASLGAWQWLNWHNGSPIVHVHESPATFPLYAGNLRQVSKAGPRIIAVNEVSADAITNLLGTRPHVIPPAVDSLASRSDRRRSQRLKVVGLGTATSRKGADLFCEVARKVVDDLGRSVDFVWIGGPGDVDMEGLIKSYGLGNRIRLAGEIRNPGAFLSKASVLLLPSREDPFPLAALEAAAQGVPAVCFDVLADGIGGFIREAGGQMVPAYDTSAMADAVTTLLRDECARQSASENAARASIAFQIDKVAPRIYSVMNDGADPAPNARTYASAA